MDSTANRLVSLTTANGDTTNDFNLIVLERAPTAATVALAGAGAGNVDNGAHLVKVVFTTAAGHTQGGTASAAVTVVNKAVNGKVAISAIPTGSVFTTGRAVYMTAAGGSVYYLLSNGTIANNTATTLTANDSDATLLASTVLAATNTTANSILAYDGPTGNITIGTGTGTAIDGSTGAVDNAVLRADGIGGSTLQSSAVLIADTTGIISGTQGVTFTGSSSGTTALVPTAAASGTLTLPAANDTLVGKATSDTLTNKTLTSPIITNIAPGADFTLNQNSVNPFTSVNSGAIVNTLYLNAGRAAIGGTTTSGKLHVTSATSNEGAVVQNTVAADGQSTPLFIVATNAVPTVSNISIEATSNNAANSSMIVRTGGSGANGFGTGRMTIGPTGTVTWSTALTNSAGTPGSLCYNTSTFEMTKNNALTCTVSASEFKTAITPLTNGLDVLLQMNPSQFAYKDDPSRLRWGFVADELQTVDSKLADGYNADGEAKSIDFSAIMAIATKAMQELNDKVDILERRLLVLRGHGATN